MHTPCVQLTCHEQHFSLQWSYGVTCWELFTGGKIPYPGVDPVSLSSHLENGHRLDKPNNAACSEEMLVLLATTPFYKQGRGLVIHLPSSNLLRHVIHLRINHSAVFGLTNAYSPS